MQKIYKKILFITLICIFLLNSFSYALITVDSDTYIYEDFDFDTSDIEKSIYDYFTVKCKLIGNSVKIGDEVTYGYFDTPIEWKILDRVDDKVLIISKYILHTLPYNNTWNPITWETCSLRKWLNEDFYEKAFNENEKKYIVATRNVNHENHLFRIKGCPDTIDKAFILSSDEVRKYYNKNSSMKAVGTDACINNGLWISKSGMTSGYSVWWLRTPGKNSSFASLIHAGGSVGDGGDGVATTGNGVRPCIWVKLRLFDKER